MTENEILAAPIVQPPGAVVVAQGMTLRDYFAAMAMQTLAGMPVEELPTDTNLTMGEWLGRQCYAYADALIEARSLPAGPATPSEPPAEDPEPIPDPEPTAPTDPEPTGDPQ